MTKAKISSKNFHQWALNLTTTLTTISVGAVCLAPAIAFLTFVPETFAQYGLGLPKSAGSGGATRSADTEKPPQIIMIVPEDGAKSFSSRPTFYWYITDLLKDQSNLNTASQKVTNLVDFFLRDGSDQTSKPIFTVQGKIDKPGLYKFTLPENSPELVTGKVQGWQIRWQINGNPLINVKATIRRDQDLVVAKAIAEAKTDLEKARIFAKNAYWYDAIDAYTNWLIKNPKDTVALTERGDLLKSGFKNHRAFSNDQQANIAKLLTKLDATAPISANLQPKKLEPITKQGE
jgi:hypothetical protein